MPSRPWIHDFLKLHKQRFAPTDWPTTKETCDAYAADWIAEFDKLGVSMAEAERASERLRMTPPQFRRDHLPAVVAAVRAARGGPPPPAHAPIDHGHEARVRAHWDSLPEADREAWRARVKAAFPGLAARESFVLANAMNWAADPSLAFEPRPSDPRPRRRRRIAPTTPEPAPG